MKETTNEPRTAGHVFWVFLVLGLTSFGGPVAHLGYFREAFVVRRRWLSEAAYADLVALCQFMPGPASSQTGMALGLMRAGLPGMLAAFLGFTLPSAIAMTAFAYGIARFGETGDGGWLLGLKLVALAVVAQALLGMARNLCPDRPRTAIAFLAAALVLVIGAAWGQILVIVLGGLAGLAVLRLEPPAAGDGALVAVPLALANTALVAVLLLFAGITVLAFVPLGTAWEAVLTYLRAGALVFGGGHVVLPLLESGTVGAGLMDRDTFLAGYGAAQAVPGPLFTFAAYLGTLQATVPDGLLGALLATLLVFLPSFLLVLGLLPHWQRLRKVAQAQYALAGVNAAVVGLLGAALYDPVFTAAVSQPSHLATALVAFLLIHTARLPPWLVVLLGAGAGEALVLLGQGVR